MLRLFALMVVLGTLLGGCVKERYIPYTKVIDTKVHREIIKIVENYRHALERKDAAALLAMASPTYFEDSATPGAEDDYGYSGLRDVLVKRLKQVKSLRYSMQYMNVKVQRNHAFVDVYIDGSFRIETPQGMRWDRKQEPHRFVLVHDGKRWLFQRGM